MIIVFAQKTYYCYKPEFVIFYSFPIDCIPYKLPFTPSIHSQPTSKYYD